MGSGAGSRPVACEDCVHCGTGARTVRWPMKRPGVVSGVGWFKEANTGELGHHHGDLDKLISGDLSEPNRL